MNTKDFLQVGQKIQISRENKNSWYCSITQGVGKDSFDISIPYDQNVPLILSSGQLVTIKIIQPKEIFEFNSVVKGRKLDDNIPLFSLSLPESVKRVQRRNFLRIPHMLSILYAEKNEDQESEFIKTHTLDISGGGMRFVANKNYPPNTLMDLKLQIPLGDIIEEIATPGKVVRTTSTESKSFHVAMEFVKIKVRDQDFLVRYILSVSTKDFALPRVGG
jgi:c-di-GMP-binding flagellar brake protein YcgR